MNIGHAAPAMPASWYGGVIEALVLRLADVMPATARMVPAMLPGQERTQRRHPTSAGIQMTAQALFL